VGAILRLPYEDLVKEFGRLPGPFESFHTLLTPIVLIALRSAAMFRSNPPEVGLLRDILVFIGDAIFALLPGVYFAMRLAPKINK
jgi:GntP family gluconate:H+ symporter